MSAERFKGKVAIVTGAAHGIGRASAERLGSEGASVAMVDIDADLVESEAAKLAAQGITTAAFAADVSDATAVAGFVAGALDRFGQIDVLHNNAGRQRAGDVTVLDLEEWDRTFAVNVRSIMLGCREVIPIMLQRGSGIIVNTASSSGLVGEANTPAYNASKAAIINLTKQMAADFARKGIRVNCVCPGWVPTGFNAPSLEGMSDEDVDAMVDANVPVGRQGTPEEIAGAVAFLASDDATYVSGHALVIDGGLTAVR
jgi:NAD(P)-dependent dehydrogenase (short-subunit alcohol dehydrogenase family)